MQICDLHTHSTCSDGTYTPTELIGAAVRAGLSAVALCDHNTVGGIQEFLQAAAQTDVTAIPGVEISTDYGEKELHILGLFLPMSHLEDVTNYVSAFLEHKREANRQLVKNLAKAGCPLSYDALAAQVPSGVFQRPHIAAELVAKGYVSSISDAFDGLLAKNGPCYVSPKRPTVFATISFLRSLGAVPVLAHPFLELCEQELRAFLPRAIAHGLLGMETHYTTYDTETTALARAIAAEYGLAESGGSDFHGAKKPDIALGSGRGSLHVPLSFATRLQSFACGVRALRKAEPHEVDTAYRMIEEARAYQREQGFVQWKDNNPNRDTVCADLLAGKGYFFTEDDVPLGYVYVDFEGEPAYLALENGDWQFDLPYAAVHRVAFGKAARGKGASRDLFRLIRALCAAQQVKVIRIDTHKDNLLMQHVLAREGFSPRGIVRYYGGTELRTAYEGYFDTETL